MAEEGRSNTVETSTGFLSMVQAYIGELVTLNPSASREDLTSTCVVCSVVAHTV